MQARYVSFQLPAGPGPLARWHDEFLTAGNDAIQASAQRGAVTALDHSRAISARLPLARSESDREAGEAQRSWSSRCWAASAWEASACTPTRQRCTCWLPFSHFQCLFFNLVHAAIPRRAPESRLSCRGSVHSMCLRIVDHMGHACLGLKKSSRFARCINATCTHRFKVDEATSVEKQTESMLHMPPTIPAHHSQGSLLPPQENNAARARSMTPAPKKMIQMTTPTAI